MGNKVLSGWPAILRLESSFAGTHCAIAFILVATSIGWFILGGTIHSRTVEYDYKLKEEWPRSGRSAGADAAGRHRRRAAGDAIRVAVDGKKVVKTETTNTTVPLPIESSRIQVNLDLDYRKKGLLWYSTYGVNFSGHLHVRNTTGAARDCVFLLTFPAKKAIYDSVVMEVNGQPLRLASTDAGASVAGESRRW